jgi:hypothetical protein
VYLPKISVVLLPPKAKELESAVFKFADLAPLVM